MDAQNLDGYGSADLAIRHAIRLEGSRRPLPQDRKNWAAQRAARQSVVHARGGCNKFGIKFGRQ